MTDPQRQHLVTAFRGPVSCRRDGGVSPGLTLIGAPADGSADALILTIMGTAPQDLPRTLQAPSVETLDGQRCRITSSPREWVMSARALVAHRDVGAAFYQALPPRSVPWKKRLTWRLMLLLAGGRAGRRVLRALRAR